MTEKNYSLQTQALHSGYTVGEVQNTCAVPIYQSTAYVFEDSDDAADLFSLSKLGNIYTRLTNPTNDVLEKRLAALEGGIAAVVTSSGTAATVTALLTLLKAGDHIVSSNSLYGGTFNLLNVTLPRLGITTTFVDPSDPQNFADAIQNNTRAILGDSIGNPKLDVLDIEAIAKIAQNNDIPFIVDNTIPSPALLQPLKHGANIVIESLSKYCNGNGTSLGGAIVDGGTFNWANGKFPEFTEPSAGYHGLVYHDALAEAAFIIKVRIEGLRDYGAALSPFNAFQIIQGLETLGIRMQKHSDNALALAQWLEQHNDIEWVNYPGLSSSKYKQLADTYLAKGSSGVVTFGVKGGYEVAKHLANNTRLFGLMANFGDSKSTIIHPASTTHQQLTEDEQLSTGVGKDLIRLSVGLEDIEDLKNDIQQALNKAKSSLDKA